MSTQKVVFITGAGKRVGAVIARFLHARGMRVAIHYNSSAKDAQALCEELNNIRADSAMSLQADLHNISKLQPMIDSIIHVWGRLDVLINNASSFHPTPIGTITEENWQDLLGTNLKAPLFLAQAAAPHLKQQQGCIINIVDIHASQPLKSYVVYCIAKAGLVMLTKVLAKELGPEIRVNAVAPGAVLWPENENELEAGLQEKIVSRTLLKRPGSPQEVANAVNFFIQDANYVTGQVLAVDGGRSLNF